MSTDYIQGVTENRLNLKLWKDMIFKPRVVFPQDIYNVHINMEDKFGVEDRLSTYKGLPDISQDLLLLIYGDLDTYLNSSPSKLEDLVMSISYSMGDDYTIKAIGLKYGIDVKLEEDISAAEVLIETLISIIYYTEGYVLDDIIDIDYDTYISINPTYNYDDYINRLVIFTIDIEQSL